jgi:selenide,water dikinase
MIAVTTTLNKVGAELGADKHVHAVTDVTGFGVLGHALELARGSGLAVVLQADALPLLKDAAILAEKGFVTGASHRNWASYGQDVALPAGLPEWKRHLLVDPQTSGGLLISCAETSAPSILARIRNTGLPAARVIGRTEAGKPLIKII